MEGGEEVGQEGTGPEDVVVSEDRDGCTGMGKGESGLVAFLWS